MPVDNLTNAFGLNLDKPPLVIRTDASKTVGYTIGAIVLATFFALGPYRQTSSLVVFFTHALACILFLVALLGTVLLVRPTFLELSSDGIEYSTLFRNRKYLWRDVTDIQYKKFWNGSASTYWIVVSLRPGHEKASSQVGVGEDTAIIEGRGWPMSAEELSNILIDFRSRWSSKNAAT